MEHIELLGKSNRDLSYSVSIGAGKLVKHSFVDFYNDATGSGYQRLESLRTRRGREIEDYIRRCKESQLEPRLFEMTANARLTDAACRFSPLDDRGHLGIMELDVPDAKKWLSIIDGGTRLLGIENALVHRIIDEETSFDVRLFIGLTVPEEVAQFLLINEKQKRVRTDLSVRVVQRRVDEGNLSEQELKILQTVVPDTDAWRFEASRIAGRMNTDPDSPWRGLVRMPGEDVPRPLNLQAFWASLKQLLSKPDIISRLDQMERQGKLLVGGQRVGPTEFTIQVLKNFWNAVATVNPDAHAEPDTSVLWGSIGVSSCHIALAEVVETILQYPEPDLTMQRMQIMIKESLVADYPFWFTKAGTRKPAEHYPGQKGEAPVMTGAANYGRLAKRLETEWRAALHTATSKGVARA